MLFAKHKCIICFIILAFSLIPFLNNTRLGSAPNMESCAALTKITLNAGTSFISAELAFYFKKIFRKLIYQLGCVNFFNAFAKFIFDCHLIKPNMSKLIDTNDVVPSPILNLHYDPCKIRAQLTFHLF